VTTIWPEGLGDEYKHLQSLKWPFSNTKAIKLKMLILNIQRAWTKLSSTQFEHLKA